MAAKGGYVPRAHSIGEKNIVGRLRVGSLDFRKTSEYYEGVQHLMRGNILLGKKESGNNREDRLIGGRA